MVEWIDGMIKLILIKLIEKMTEGLIAALVVILIVIWLYS